MCFMSKRFKFDDVSATLVFHILIILANCYRFRRSQIRLLAVDPNYSSPVFNFSPYGFELMADHFDGKSILFAADFSYIDSICRLDL
ncbi:hypothetical protein Hanom_Chr07g00604531 [Helianthus anomalus]